MRRTLLLAGAVLLLAGGLILCLKRVPEGEIGMRLSGQEGPVQRLAQGWHLAGPFGRIVLSPAGPRTYTGTLTRTTPEGATLARSFRLEIDLARADAGAISALARRLERLQSPQRAIEQTVNEAAGLLPPGWADADLERALAPLGLTAGTLRLSGDAPLLAGQTGRNPLLASHVRPPWSVLVIGVDSADWDVMEPLIARGALPHVEALRRQGAWGTLRSMSPTLSPLLWTTAATGKSPEQHGIIDFLMKDPATGAEVPISRVFRRVKAIWNIASDFRIPTLTVGWWATWPAERVEGVMVTDRVAYSLFDLPMGDRQIGAVHPDEAARDVAELKVDPESIPYEDLRQILEVAPAEYESARSALGTPEAYEDPVAHLLKILAGTQTYHRAAIRFLSQGRPALSLVYYEGLDEVNHRFAHYMPPPMSLVKGEPASRAAAYGAAVEAFYRYQDRLIGELVSAAGPQAVVVVMSDHGFANGAERPIDMPPDVQGKPGRWHTMDGVFLAAGEPIRAGRIQRPVSLLDVTPTLLALLGLPQAADMPGRVLEEILQPPFERTALVAPSSYEEIGEPLQTGSAASTSQDREMIAKLAALGYVQSGEASTAGTGTPTYHINAGHIFFSKGDLRRAEQEFSRARELAPHWDQPMLGLAQVMLQSGRADQALPLIEEALAEAGEPLPGLFTRAAVVYIRARQLDRGLRFLSGLRQTGLREAYRLTAIGMLHESMGEPDRALESYRSALGADPSVERALGGAYSILKARGDLEPLAGLLQASLASESIAVGVKAANWLALTRELQDRRAEAMSLLEETLRRAPDDVMTLTNLGSMLLREDRPGEALPHLARAYRARPRAFEVLVNLVVAEGKLGHLEQARRYFAEGETVARRPELYNAIALASYLGGARQEALRYINQSLSLKPDQPDALRLKERITAGS